MEQQALYEQFDQQNAGANIVQGNEACCAPTGARGTLLGDAVASGNGAVVAQVVSNLLCPSDTGELFLPAASFYAVGSGLAGAKTNYDFNVTANYECRYWTRQPGNELRLFGENTAFSAKHVTDGLSRTIAMAETLRNVHNGQGNAWGYRGWVMMGIDVGHNRINVTHWPGVIQEPSPERLRSYGHAGSLHAGGANLLLADGSVLFLAEVTDPSVLEALSTMAGEELVSLP